MPRFKLNEIKDDHARKVYEFLEESITSQARREWADKRKKCWEFFENEQWTAEEKRVLIEAQMPDLVINKYTSLIRTKAAIMTDNKPDINVTPVGGGDSAVSEVLERAADKTWEAEQVNSTLFRGCIEAQNGGLGWLRGAWNKNAGVFGKFEIKEVDPESVHIDPNVKKSDIYGGRFILVAERVDKDEAKKRYGVSDEDLADVDTVGDSAASTGHGTSGDGYTSPDREEGLSEEAKTNTCWVIEAWVYDYEQQQFAFDSQTGQTNPMPKKVDTKRVNQMAEAVDDPVRVVDKTIRRVEHSLIVGVKVVEPPKVNPYGLSNNLEPLCGLVAIIANEQRGAYPVGDGWYLIDPQRELNKRRGQAIHVVSTQTGSNPMYEEGTVDDPTAFGKLGKAIAVKPQTSQWPTRLTPGSIGSEVLVAMMQFTEKDMQDIAALPEALQGKASGQDSGKKVLALQEAGMMGAKPIIRSLEAAIELIGRLLVQLQVMFAPRDWWLRLIDPKKDQELLPGLQPVLARDVSVTQFDVNVGAGSSLPSNRIAKMEVLAELSRAFGPDYMDIFAELVARYVDEPEFEDRIKQRNLENRQMKAQQMAMQMQAAQAQAGGAIAA